MSNIPALAMRYGILSLAFAVCVLKVLYFYTLGLHDQGAVAAYDQIMQIAYTILATWTVQYAGISTSKGWQTFAATNPFLRMTMGTYVLAMACGAAFGLFQDGLAQGHLNGNQALFGVGQILAEFFVLYQMGHDLWALVTTAGGKLAAAADEILS